MILPPQHPKHCHFYETLLQQNVSIQFGCRVKALREQSGRNQTELADDVGIDRAFLSDVERGKTSISLDHIAIIAQGFGLSLSEMTVDI
jgi:transcriptional regulator with XRE-family HTH domain